MAKFECDARAMDDLVRSLENTGIYDEENVKDLLFDAGEIFVETAKQMAIRAGHVDSWAMVNHISFKRKVLKKDGTFYINLSVMGKDKEQVKNAVKAFVLNYGRSVEHGFIPGSHFWNEAVIVAGPKMIHAMEEKMNYLLAMKGLI